MKRKISGLVWAKATERPKGLPVGRARGRKAAGVRYERELAKGLILAQPGAQLGLWWEFEDRGGSGFCQTDLVFPAGAGRLHGELAVVEVKYTWTPEAQVELDKLYLPVVSAATRKTCLGLVVCRVLTTETPREAVCGTLAEALGRAASGHLAVLHWLGDLGALRTSAEPLGSAHLSRAAKAA